MFTFSKLLREKKIVARKKKKQKPEKEKSPVHEYWRTDGPFGGRFLYDVVTRLKNRKKQIISDWTFYAEEKNGKIYGKVQRNDRWTDEPKTVLISKGYYKAIKLYDTMSMWLVPVFIRFHGDRVFDVTATDEKGRLLYSQDTPVTLNDQMESTATDRFIKQLGKTALPHQSIQQLAFIGILGQGTLLGLFMMGAFK